MSLWLAGEAKLACCITFAVSNVAYKTARLTYDELSSQFSLRK